MRSAFVIAVFFSLLRLDGLGQSADSLSLRAAFHDTAAMKPSAKTRQWIVGGTEAAVWTGTFIGLNQAWYKDYPRGSFHFFNDWGEWQQMDKAGHLWTSYQLSRLSGDLWTWAGLKGKKAAVVGGITGVAYMSVIEVLDGFSSEWGFSMGDMLMNVGGASLYTVQQIAWKKQTIQVKLSYVPYQYPPELRQRSNDLFGSSPVSRLLKDYNSQTYWVNVNLKDVFPSSKIPGWLCVSMGYGARVMVGARENKWTNDDGTVTDRTDIKRYRRFFLSADVDLTRIRTRSKVLKTVFSIENLVKIPAPAIEWNGDGVFRLHALYY